MLGYCISIVWPNNTCLQIISTLLHIQNTNINIKPASPCLNKITKKVFIAQRLWHMRSGCFCDTFKSTFCWQSLAKPSAQNSISSKSRLISTQNLISGGTHNHRDWWFLKLQYWYEHRLAVVIELQHMETTIILDNRIVASLNIFISKIINRIEQGKNATMLSPHTHTCTQKPQTQIHV